MTIANVLIYAGLAMVYGAIATGCVLGVMRLIPRAVPPRTRVSLVPFVFTTLTFIFLTQHPFPDPARLICPVPGTRPQLHVFYYLKEIGRLWRAGDGLSDWIFNRALAAAAMNFLLCAVIGLTLAPHPVRLPAVLLLGLALTLAVEFTQLTGTWGLYPCAYRQFDVDDLIMNALGLPSGFVLARYIQRRVQRKRQSSTPNRT